MSSVPVILLDVDGVLVDKTHEHLAAINARFGTSFTYKDVTDWNYSYMTPEQIRYQNELWDSPTLYDNEELSLAYLATLSELRKMGRVIACTSPFVGHASSKYRFLRRCGFSMRDIIMAKDKNLVFGDLLIDDGAHNIEEFHSRAILVDRPWNQHSGHQPRVYSFEDLPTVAERLLW